MVTSVVLASQKLLAALRYGVAHDVEFWDAATADEVVALSTGASTVVLEATGDGFGVPALVTDLRVLKPNAIVVVVSTQLARLDARDFMAADFLLAARDATILARLLPAILRFAAVSGRASIEE